MTLLCRALLPMLLLAAGSHALAADDSCGGTCQGGYEACQAGCGAAEDPDAAWVECENTCAETFQECMNECPDVSVTECIDRRTGLIVPCD